MSEDVNQEGQEPEKKEVKVDPFVERATELGWRPIDEWDGAEEDFIDAKEFVRRQPLFEKIEQQSREIRAVKQALDAFKTHHSKVKETEFNRALAALKAEKRRALSDGETDRALAIEDQMDDIVEQKERFEQEAVSQPEPQANPEFLSWTKQNAWYGTDRAMTAYADRLGVELHQQGLSPTEVLDRVAREVKAEFKHKVTNQRRERAGSVESGSRQTVNTNEPDFQLSDDERRIMNKIVSTGAMTKEQYIADLKKVRG